MSILEELLDLYRHLHSHPELSFQEVRRRADRGGVERAGAEVTGGGELGRRRRPEERQGPDRLVRTDLDALPVTEKTGLPYASKVTRRRRATRSASCTPAATTCT